MRGVLSQRVLVGLSGGVDSAVAALLLLQAGYRVEALHMTNWDEGDEHCTAGQDLADARQVAADLGIPFHHVNFAAEYRARVFADFIDDYRAGRTPNPDVACNRHIKFGAFLEHAQRLGADLIATGHYARVGREPVRLLKAADAAKDQTYFLHAVDRDALERTLFPLGALEKRTIRQLARDHGFAVHAKRDSTGICFIGERPFRDFLSQHLAAAPGPIVSEAGAHLGEHAGLPFYTLGQRQGLGIGGRSGDAHAPWYVASKDAARNALVVVQGHDHPWLMTAALTAVASRWIGDVPEGLDAGRTLHLEARIRHRQMPAPCALTRLPSGQLHVSFGTPQRAAAPGQYIVFYADDECLGGATIETTTHPEIAGMAVAAGALH